MKVLQLFLTVLMILFAILGLASVFEYEISQPIMFTCLVILNFINAKDYINKGDKKSANYFLLLSIINFGVIIITLFVRFFL